MAVPSPQMLTANRLTDGAVLYWKSGGWVEDFALGDVFAAQADADAALAEAQAFVARNEVVGVYLFDVHADGSPVKEREIIRARGPSVKDLTSPSRGGRRAQRAGREASAKPPIRSGSAGSTAPQGEGEEDSFDVSI